MQSSTRNLSHTRNAGQAPRRVALPFRPWTYMQWLLHKHGITNRTVADVSGVPLATVSRCLSIRHFKRTGFASVTKVRDACQALLIERGIAVYHPRLWDDYDRAIFEGEGEE